MQRQNASTAIQQRGSLSFNQPIIKATLVLFIRKKAESCSFWEPGESLEAQAQSHDSFMLCKVAASLKVLGLSFMSAMYYSPNASFMTTRIYIAPYSNKVTPAEVKKVILVPILSAM